jgi:hypothetical protein
MQLKPRIVATLQEITARIQHQEEDKYVVNPLLHMAASLVLTSEGVKSTMAAMDRDRSFRDSSSALTVATLRHVMDEVPDQRWDGVKKRFENLGWLIGTAEAQKLGL